MVRKTFFKHEVNVNIQPKIFLYVFKNKSLFPQILLFEKIKKNNVQNLSGVKKKTSTSITEV